ncbi:MAG: NADH-quinone oxidoreductase subunit L [Ignavibacteriales bacterium]|nr:NADH-quinone oxidoreductase subunit L [Ignavibacteriales bacterium]
MLNYASYIIIIPFVGFLLNGLFGKKINNEKISGTIGSLAVFFPFVIAVGIFFEMLNSPIEERSHIIQLFDWISAGSLSIPFALQVDQLSILMTLIVTGVGFLIHVYSIGYMHGDKGFWRFFTYLNLFITMMLFLVLGNNFLLMFLGWEGVGLCSFLLIGFWHDRKFEVGGADKETSMTTDAAKKAFVVNRVGDFGFLIGMFLIFTTFGSLTFTDVFSKAASLQSGSSVMFWITMCLFIGATGKSAQIPLFVWLPDAMAGPTPVSALIHAATMVTSGIYMIARCSILFALAPETMNIVAIVGISTAVFAATIGLVQNDIKKVLAYSTVSQLGYMFLALGVGAFTAGIFHVMTHAFFKALLFLGSGAVIHAMHEEQDIQKMGGLKKYLPITFITFLIGTIAISGIPPFAGFFSKDEILWKAYSQGNIMLWLLGAIGAALTAFYMFRLVSLTFENKPRFDSHHTHPHEAPKTMTIPLIILAVLSIVGGFVGIPESLGGGNVLEKFLEPIFEKAEFRLPLHHEGSHSMEYILMAISVLIATISILYARKKFVTQESLPVEENKKGFRKLLWNKYYVDEIYNFLFVNSTYKLSESFLWKIFDVKLVDGIVNGTASLISIISGQLRKIQVGVAQSYATVFVVGIIVILGILLM